MPTELEIKHALTIMRLKVALDNAPRPSVSGDEGWPVRYMDWYFKDRAAALKD